MSDQGAKEHRTAVAPMLSVRNEATAIEFIRRRSARLSVEAAGFWVAEESPEHLNFRPKTSHGGTVRLVMIVNDPDPASRRAVAAGGKVVRPISDA
jgi:PhnB protein